MVEDSQLVLGNSLISGGRMSLKGIGIIEELFTSLAACSILRKETTGEQVCSPSSHFLEDLKM